MRQDRRIFLTREAVKKAAKMPKIIGIGLVLSLCLRMGFGMGDFNPSDDVAESLERILTSGFGEAHADALEALNPEEIYGLVSEKVFYLRVYQKDGSLKTVGTGFLLDDGRALTAAHVVDGGVKFEASFVETATGSPKTYFSKLIKINKENDIAILELQGLPEEWTKKGQSLKWSSEGLSKPLRHGQAVFALGYPLKDTRVITEGIINTPEANLSGKMRLLASATIAPGMSGGPLVNDRGELVGLISGSTKTMNEMHVIVPLKIIQTMIGGQ